VKGLTFKQYGHECQKICTDVCKASKSATSENEVNSEWKIL